jgi:murein DD-endopeptidase MepM/ murein hydrolase activator NlpD
MPLRGGGDFASLDAMPRVRLVAGAVAVAGMLALAPVQPAAASSAKVAALQAALKYRGLYPVAVDGVRGPFTARGVRGFQRRRGLLVDGIAGPQTKQALRSRSLGSRPLRRGNRGWDVAALQFRLQRHGFPPGGVDGVFGPATNGAVTSFQSANGLGADGIAGPATISALRGRSSSTTTPTAPVGDVRFFRPVAGPIGDRFGAPRAGGRRHAGIDFPVPYGTRVAAAGVGTTIFAGWNSGGYGNLVVVQHRLGYTTWYAHLSQITSWVGEQVSGGTRIGYVGSTGYSTGPHLHFEVRRWNTPIDPIPYLLSSTAARGTARVHCADPDAYRRARIDDCRPAR